MEGMNHQIGKLSRYTSMSSGFNLFSVVLTIVTTVASFYLSLSAPGSASTFPGLFLVLFCVVLISWIFGREFWLSRKQKYANITNHYSILSSKIGKLTTELIDEMTDLVSSSAFNRKITDKIFVECVEGILNDFAIMFDLLTSTKCRSSIKIIPWDQSPPSPGAEYVVCFARDLSSGPGNRQADRRRAEQKSDTISGNSDFQSLIFDSKDQSDYYINNNIVKSVSKGTFKSTSLEYYRRKKIDSDDGRYVGRELLPYRSTMVWPMRTFEVAHGSVDKSKFIGFLCVDSEYNNVFNHRWDKNLGASVADQLVNVFYLKRQIDILVALQPNGGRK